ncbi:hypothetical protein MOV08_36800 [Streptomyces yunnanensis]|uniref:Uncharacterized protein n=1 Tax=Streptomyces yunnanensis TaxID=156453 RepID=A0ABY8AH79_9ACTN|nr:hypothetical protein [Streptomyces yunnanensis]WEB44308.1 hypothetical protein MOV08_36800 [Streptomyces yunnanensis]
MPPFVADQPDRTIFDAGQSTDLPGNRTRGEQDTPTTDQAVNEAFDGLGSTFTFYYDVFQRRSIDGAGLPGRGEPPRDHGRIRLPRNEDGHARERPPHSVLHRHQLAR